MGYNPYVSGRDETIWGPDALEYRPERWLNEAGEVIQVSEGKYPQFNGGPRYGNPSVCWFLLPCVYEFVWGLRLFCIEIFQKVVVERFAFVKASLSLFTHLRYHPPLKSSGGLKFSPS